MATDSLIQIGKDFNKTREITKHVTRRGQKNLPIIEKSLDLVGSLYDYKMEFYTYSDSFSVILDITFYQKYVVSVY